MTLLRLVLAEWRHRKVRFALTAAAVALAVSLVVAMDGGLQSLRAAAFRALDSFFGTVDVVVEPKSKRDVIPAETVAALMRHPDVRSARPQLRTASFLQNEEGEPLVDWAVRIVGMRPQDRQTELAPPMVGGRWFERSDAAEAVLGQTLAQRAGLKVGDHLYLPGPEGRLKIKLVGVTAKPAVLWMSMPTVHLPIDTLRSWYHRPGEANRMELDLRQAVPSDAFVERAASELPGSDIELRWKTAGSQRGRLEEGLGALALAAGLAGAVAIATAAFIVFATLSMGVTERARMLGMLRAVGATRLWVGTLVIVEGLVVALPAGLLGVGLGWCWCRAMVAWKPKVFVAGVELGAAGVARGLAVAGAAALLASLLPAVSAARLRPLEAMTAMGRPATARTRWQAAAFGILLLAIDPLVAWTPGLDAGFRFNAHLFAGLPGVVIGLFLISPLAITLLEKALVAPVAWTMRVPAPLLRHALSGAAWRSAGTAAALMVGLLSLTVIQVHGRSMLAGWKLPDRFPDMVMLHTSPFGLSKEAVMDLESIEGIRAGTILPVVYERPRLKSGVLELFNMVPKPESTVLFGLDVERALRGAADGGPLVELDFREGDVDTALAKLKTGRHAIVTEEFTTLKGLGVGDTIEIQTPKSGAVAYTIAGVVRAAGADLIMRLYDLESEFETWTGTSVLTTFENVERDFGPQRIHIFLFNLDTDRPKAEVEALVKAKLRAFGLMGADARKLKASIDRVISRLIDLLGTLALAAIGVAALGVANTMAASVRARRWTLGVLRSQGLQRGVLVRLILAEAILIGLWAVALGWGGGLLLSVDANRLAGHLVGYRTELVVPAAPLLWGAALTGVTAAAASVVPALRAALSSPMALLTSGRSST